MSAPIPDDLKDVYRRCKEQEATDAAELIERIGRAEANIVASVRLIWYRYMEWQKAGGPDECAHGYAKGIPCRACDVDTVMSARAALSPQNGGPPVSAPIMEPMSVPGWKQDNDGSVVLTMTQDDWAQLLLTIGYAIGATGQNGNSRLHGRMLALVNRLNIGNPHFTPYKVGDNLK